MLFAIYTIAKPNSESVIERLHAEHRAYHAPKLKDTYFAGPLYAEDGKTRIGGLSVVEFSDQEEAERFHLNQPYCRAGIIDVARVHPFKPLVEHGKMLADYHRDHAVTT